MRIAYDSAPDSLHDSDPDSDPDSETIDDVITLLTKYWHLSKPDLVISVIGGGKRFRMSNRRRREMFNNGLIKVMFVFDFIGRR